MCWIQYNIIKIHSSSCCFRSDRHLIKWNRKFIWRRNLITILHFHLFLYFFLNWFLNFSCNNWFNLFLIVKIKIKIFTFLTLRRWLILLFSRVFCFQLIYMKMSNMISFLSELSFRLLFLKSLACIQIIWRIINTLLSRWIKWIVIISVNWWFL